MSVTTAVAAVALWRVAAAIDDPVEASFHTFMNEFERSYEKGSSEYNQRFQLFKERLAEIQAHNAEPTRLWTAGVNHFTDQTEEERAMARGYKPVARPGDDAVSQDPPPSELADDGTVLDQMDWKNLSIAMTIPDQGSCGSCWAVTTASVLDAHYEIYVGKGRRFSAQELVSCVKNPKHCGGKGGCDGATVELGMAYALQSGLTTLTETPYQGKDTPCGTLTMPVLAQGNGDGDGNGHGHREAKGHAFGLVGWETLPSNKEAPLVRALVEKGPVAISVSAAKWFSYKAGVFNSCSDNVVDHAVTLYGYGKEGSQKYWLIRNSWGVKWGENGFIRMTRSDSEETKCGWDHDPAKGTGCDGGPSKVYVCGTCGILYDNVVPTFNKTKIPSKLYKKSRESSNDDSTQSSQDSSDDKQGGDSTRNDHTNTDDHNDNDDHNDQEDRQDGNVAAAVLAQSQGDLRTVQRHSDVGSAAALLRREG